MSNYGGGFAPDQQAWQGSMNCPSSSPNRPRFQAQLPAPPGFIPHQAQSQSIPQQKIGRDSLFPTSSLEFNIISRAFSDAAAYKDSVLAMSSLCERLKTELITKEREAEQYKIEIARKDGSLIELRHRLSELEDKLGMYDSKLHESLELLKQDRREIALLKGQIYERDLFIRNSIHIKKEHDVLEIPDHFDVGIYDNGKLPKVSNASKSVAGRTGNNRIDRVSTTHENIRSDNVDHVAHDDGEVELDSQLTVLTEETLPDASKSSDSEDVLDLPYSKIPQQQQQQPQQHTGTPTVPTLGGQKRKSDGLEVRRTSSGESLKEKTAKIKENVDEKTSVIKQAKQRAREHPKDNLAQLTKQELVKQDLEKTASHVNQSSVEQAEQPVKSPEQPVAEQLTPKQPTVDQALDSLVQKTTVPSKQPVDAPVQSPGAKAAEKSKKSSKKHLGGLPKVPKQKAVGTPKKAPKQHLPDHIKKAHGEVQPSVPKPTEQLHQTVQPPPPTTPQVVEDTPRTYTPPASLFLPPSAQNLECVQESKVSSPEAYSPLDLNVELMELASSFDRPNITIKEPEMILFPSYMLTEYAQNPEYAERLAKLEVGCVFHSFAIAKFYIFLFYLNCNSFYVDSETVERVGTGKPGTIKIVNKLHCGDCGDVLCELKFENIVDDLIRLTKFDKDHICTWEKITENFTGGSSKFELNVLSQTFHNDFKGQMKLYRCFLNLQYPKKLTKFLYRHFIYLFNCAETQMPTLKKLNSKNKEILYIDTVNLFLRKKRGLDGPTLDSVTEFLEWTNTIKSIMQRRYNKILEQLNDYGLQNELSKNPKEELITTLATLEGFDVSWAAFANNRIVAGSPTTPDLIILHDISKESKSYGIRAGNLVERLRGSSKEVQLHNINELGIAEDILRSLDYQSAQGTVQHDDLIISKDPFSVDVTSGKIDEEFWVSVDVQGIKPTFKDDFISSKQNWARLRDTNDLQSIIFQNKLPVKFLVEKCLPFLEIDKITLNEKGRKEENEQLCELLMISIRTSSYDHIPLAFALSSGCTYDSWLRFLSTFYHQNESFLKGIPSLHVITTSDQGVRSAVISTFNKRKVIFHTSVRHLIRDVQQYCDPLHHDKIEELINVMCFSNSSKIVQSARLQILGFFGKSFKTDFNFAYALINTFYQSFATMGTFRELNVTSIEFTEDYEMLARGFRNSNVPEIIKSLLSIQKLKFANAEAIYTKSEESSTLPSTQLVPLGNILYSVSLSLSRLFTVIKRPDSTFLVYLKEDFKMRYDFDKFFKIVQNLHNNYMMEEDFFRVRRVQYVELYQNEAILTQEKGFIRKFRCSICVDLLKNKLVACPHEIALIMFKDNLMTTKELNWDTVLSKPQWIKYQYNDKFYVNPKLFKDYVPNDENESKLLPPLSVMDGYKNELLEIGVGAKRTAEYGSGPPTAKRSKV